MSRRRSAIGSRAGYEAFLALTQELLCRLVRPAVAHVEVVGKAAVVDQVLLDRARPVVRRRGIVSALDLLCRLLTTGGVSSGSWRRSTEDGVAAPPLSCALVGWGISENTS